MAKLVSYDHIGAQPVYDITVYEHHNFIANGVVVHNCMKIAQELAGFSPGDSYKFVKTIAKKLPEKMAALKQKFISGSQPRIDEGECTLHDVEVIWGLLETFAGYGFNRAHATAYSAVSTAELWLKQEHPHEFMCALINNTDPGKKKHGSTNIMVNYINYARRKQIEVKGPDINLSKNEFSITKAGVIYFALGHIKYVATQADVISEITKTDPIKDMVDFHERVKVTTIGKKGKATSRRPNKRQVESLIAAGAFDSLYLGKSGVAEVRNAAMEDYYKARNKKDEEVPQYSDEKWIELEQEAIGLCLSQEPLYDTYKDDMKREGWIAIHHLEDRKKAFVFGKVLSIAPHTSKAGNSMFIVMIGDGLDILKFFVFKGAMDFFRSKVRQGMICGFPLDRFEDSDTRFYDDRKDLGILVTPSVSPAPPPKAKTKRHISTFPHGGDIWFETGNSVNPAGVKVQDDWKCAYHPSGGHQITLDPEMLTALKKYADAGFDVMADCKTICGWIVVKGLVTLPDPAVWNDIMVLAQPYGSKEATELFGYLYYVMLAEENKKDSIVGRRMKMLGIAQVLIEGMEPGIAAIESIRKSDEWILKQCDRLGV